MKRSSSVRFGWGGRTDPPSFPTRGRTSPASWLVARDVRLGREELNFSTWGTLSAEKQREKREEIWEELAEGEMPLWFYLPLHPEARLGAEEMAVLRAWAQGPNHDAR